MTEFFNVNTGQFQEDRSTKYQKIQEWVRSNYPNVALEFRSDGIIAIKPNDQEFKLTEAQKTALLTKFAQL